MDNSIWSSIGKFLLQLLINKEGGEKGKSEPVDLNITLPVDGPEPEKPVQQKTPNMEYLPEDIDWTKATAMVTKHFTVAEAISLHSWNRLANEDDGLTDEIKANLVKTFEMMESIRTIIGCSINVHCGFRSVKYNEEVLKSLPHDVHAAGMAVDWDANSCYTIEEAKEKIRPHLEELNIRLEGGTTTWLHNDWHAVGPSGREFKA